jgi:hypothetical protein
MSKPKRDVVHEAWTFQSRSIHAKASKLQERLDEIREEAMDIEEELRELRSYCMHEQVTKKRDRACAEGAGASWRA